MTIKVWQLVIPNLTPDESKQLRTAGITIEVEPSESNSVTIKGHVYDIPVTPASVKLTTHSSSEETFLHLLLASRYFLVREYFDDVETLPTLWI